MFYTVGLQRWPLPFFKRYRVTGHELLVVGGRLRLLVTRADGGKMSLSLGRFDQRHVRVYPDYWTFEQRRKELAPPAPPAPEEPPPPEGPTVE